MSGQTASSTVPVPGPTVEQGAREAMAGQGTRAVMAEQDTRAAMAEQDTREVMADLLTGLNWRSVALLWA